jgi:hypothetical protein
MRAPVPKEAWLAVERGLYLLGFSQWAGDGQNRRHVSKAPARHVKKALFAGIYGASRDRTGDLLLAKQALSQLSYGPWGLQYTAYRADSQITGLVGLVVMLWLLLPCLTWITVDASSKCKRTACKPQKCKKSA